MSGIPEFYTGAPVDPVDYDIARSFLRSFGKHCARGTWCSRRPGERGKPASWITVIEVEEGIYDFASGVLKSWWRKYYA